jgi:hypothetical protein
MSDNHSSSHGTPHDRSLPPVEAPNARLIVQLFLVPLVLVLLVIGLIVLLFGGLGAGPQTPKEFMEGLRSPSEIKRWKTAQDLAQVLPRKPELRSDVEFALQMTELLEKERQKPPPPPPAKGKQPDPNEVPDMLDYLPAALGSFRIPVGLPMLQEIVRANADKAREQERGYRVRFRNALFAIGLLGSRLNEFDALPQEEKEAILAKLQAEAGPDTGRKTWARLAHEHLSARMTAGPGKEVKDTYEIVETLRLGARAPDEYARKFTILALANWRLPKSDELLLQMALDTSPLQYYGENDLQDEERDKDGRKSPYSAEEDAKRAQREIGYNAALALARRGSESTPWRIVKETLDEEKLTKIYEKDNHGAPASRMIVISLMALREGLKQNPKLLDKEPEVRTAVQQLTKSGNAAISVEAERFLGGSPTETVQPGHFSRQVLLMAGMAIGVFLLLGLAVFKRWQRSVPQAP